MLRPVAVQTSKPREFVDVTARVEAIVRSAAVADGPRQRTIQVQVMGEPGGLRGEAS